MKKNNSILMIDYFSPLLRFYQHANLSEAARAKLTLITPQCLPTPLDFLLTQTLLTPAIQQYYQREPTIRTPIYSQIDDKEQIYFRAITMVIDQSQQRNSPLVAIGAGEYIVVELAFIEINLKELPPMAVKTLLAGQLPFGFILNQYRVSVSSKNQQFFTLPCDQAMAIHLERKVGTTCYGRSHTLVRSKSRTWLAHVIDIL